MTEVPFRSANLAEGQISIARHDDYVSVTGQGLWSVDHTDEHFASLERLLAKVHAEGRGALVLVDLSGAAVQSAITAERVAYWTARLYGAKDRVAIVVASSLMKVQMRRVVSIACRELFLSRAEAMKWLLPSAPPD